MATESLLLQPLFGLCLSITVGGSLDILFTPFSKSFGFKMVVEQYYSISKFVCINVIGNLLESATGPIGPRLNL